MPKAAGNAASAAAHSTDDVQQNAHAAGYSKPAVGTQASSGDGDMTTTIVTVGVVAAGVALIEVAWIPGMLIGLAAAFAPKFVPKLGDGFRPLRCWLFPLPALAGC